MSGLLPSLWGRPENDGAPLRSLHREIDKVFDVFMQSTSGEKSNQGSGLGIPISQKFICMMGGGLSVKSEVGKGTLFRFDVQVAMADNADVAKPALNQKVVCLEPGQEQRRLLVVEDNDANRELLVTLLKDVGFEVREAVNGQDAVALWEEWRPHLIWMDIRMPVLDGYEATQKINAAIRSQPSTIHTKIIALTASAFEEDKIKAIENGCNDFVRKPFREVDIIDMLRKHLSVRFTYEGEDKKAPLNKPFSIVDLQPVIATLPAELLAELATASGLCDADRVDQIVGDIYNINTHLGGTLKSLSAKFAYDEILALVKKAKEA